MLQVNEAVEMLLSQARPLADFEDVALTSALGRVLARPIIAPIDLPPHDNSAMDGYAIAAADVLNHPGVRFKVSQSIAAGEDPRRLEPGSASRILTGAVLPAGADTVVIQENCVIDGDAITIGGAVEQGMYVRYAGEDVQAGQCVIDRGELLMSRHLAMIAALGLDTVSVYRRLRVAIASTGNELIMPGHELSAGKIYNSNHYCLSAQLQAMDCEIVDLGILPDDFDETCRQLESVSQQVDLILTSGGVSVGDKDMVRIAIETIGKLALWKIAMKPGKPLAFGDIAGTPVIGMPGNPVSQFVTFSVIVRPFIARLQGQKDCLPEKYLATAAFEYENRGDREEFLRARVLVGKDGTNEVHKFDSQSSASLMSLLWANCLASIPPATRISPGQDIYIISFAGLNA